MFRTGTRSYSGSIVNTTKEVTMNPKKLALIAALAATASVAFAAQEGSPLPQPFASTAQPDQIRAELVQFKAGVSPYSMKFNPVAGFRGTRTRTEVAAEYLASRDQVAATSGEDSGSAYYARVPSSQRAKFASR